MADSTSSLSGLNHAEAQEFHSLFMQGFIVFTIIALVAHILVWFWRPWLPGEGGYASAAEVQTAMLDGGQQMIHYVMQLAA